MSIGRNAVSKMYLCSSTMFFIFCLSNGCFWLCICTFYSQLMGVKVSEQELRRRLGAFGIGAELAVRSNQLLSGGQKARLAFAKLVCKNPHVLILDEPTNHLDIESIEAIGKGLSDFPGTVIFVSHDEYFCRSVATEFWQCKKELGTITQLHIGFDEYKDSILSALDENEY